MKKLTLEVILHYRHSRELHSIANGHSKRQINQNEYRIFSSAANERSVGT